MKLLNNNEQKTLLLEERDKIPLTVPGARYEMNIPQPNRHGEAMRGGIRIALRCMERCQPLTLDDLRPKGRWADKKNENVWCSVCQCHPLKDMDKDSVYCWKYEPDFCPNCVADMRGGEG